MTTTEAPDETAKAVRVDDLLIDEATGEILDAPGGADAVKVEMLTLRHLEAGENEKSWKTARQTLSRALLHRLEEAGTKSITTDTGRSTAVAPTIVNKAPAANVQNARRLELLTDEQVERLLIVAAKELDATVVEAFIVANSGDDELLERRLRDALIKQEHRAGYALSKRALAPVPEIERVEVPA